MSITCRSIMGSSERKANLSSETQCSRHESDSKSEISPAPLSGSYTYYKHSCRQNKTDNCQDGTVSSQSFSSSSSSCISTTAKCFKASGSLLPNSFLPCYNASTSSIHQLVFSTKEISSRVLLDLVSYISSKNTGYLKLRMLMTIVFIILSLNVCHTESRSTGLCRGIPCANGGQLLVSNSVWGNCRCRCRAGYAGPYCQYQIARKRSNSENVGNRRLNRSEAMERIRNRLLVLAQRLDQLDAREAAQNRNDENENLATSLEPETLSDGQAITNTEVSIEATRRLLRSRRAWHSRHISR